MIYYTSVVFFELFPFYGGGGGGGRCGDGDGRDRHFYVAIRATRRSSRLQRKGNIFISQLF